MAVAARAVDETPVFLIDAREIRHQIDKFCHLFPGILVRYPVKVNPHPIVLEAIVRAGHGFDIASMGELEAVLAVGASPSSVLFAAPIKARSHIAAAAQLGVRTYVADSTEELSKLSEYAPGSEVLIRVAVSNHGSVFSLTEKFGATKAEAVTLLRTAKDLALLPTGLAFHVGSQALDIDVWHAAVERCADIVDASEILSPKDLTLNIGGGFPVAYEEPVPSLEDIAATIHGSLAESPLCGVTIISEPGRLLVANASRLVCTVIGTAQRGFDRWLYLDVGVYNAILEALPGQGTFHFPIEALHPRGDLVDWIVAGPSCDSLDRLPGRYLLPTDVMVGDRIVISTTGAYSVAFASSFCGWPPPPVCSVSDLDVAAELA